MICADSSFIVSKYIADIHSAEADRRMRQDVRVSLTPLNRAEVAHAIHQYAFRKVMSSEEAQIVWNEFDRDCANGLWSQVGLPETIWETSIDLARRHGPRLGVRTLDSLHVACALALKAERFWTFDERQARLADAVGLATGD
ncbi:MAG TPA: type II toxin-antitoxin system VapC family toxin [Terracidiphilus sp.]|jgi:predicted nucleic acid-binding protein|nr:type II toxin-antitoxin system VapC family toxin [Terracidiphilus sp.]